MKWLKDFTDTLLHLFSFETGYCVTSSNNIKLILLASVNSSKRPKAGKVCLDFAKSYFLFFFTETCLPGYLFKKGTLCFLSVVFYSFHRIQNLTVCTETSTARSGSHLLFVSCGNESLLRELSSCKLCTMAEKEKAFKCVQKVLR